MSVPLLPLPVTWQNVAKVRHQLHKRRDKLGYFYVSHKPSNGKGAAGSGRLEREHPELVIAVIRGRGQTGRPRLLREDRPAWPVKITRGDRQPWPWLGAARET